MYRALLVLSYTIALVHSRWIATKCSLKWMPMTLAACTMGDNNSNNCDNDNGANVMVPPKALVAHG